MLNIFDKKIISEKMEKYACEHSTKESEILKELAEETYAKASFPEMQVGHLEGALLRLLVKVTKAKRILEIGTFTGYSSLVMAEGLPEDGEIITLDKDPSSTEIAKKYWQMSPHGEKIKLILGDAFDSLKKISGQFDMVFIDAHKPDYIKYWEDCIDKVRCGGLIIADNVLWSGRVLNPKSEDDFGIVSFNKHVANDSRVEAVMLTVRDGVTLAVKL